MTPPRLARLNAADDIVSRVLSYAFAVAIGWALCTSYYKVNHLWAEQNQLVHVEKVEVPKLKRDLAIAKKHAQPVLRGPKYGGGGP